MKKTLFILLIAVQALTLCACSLIKQAPDQNSSQNSAAGTDDVINYNVTIDDEGKLQYTDDQGNVIQVASNWTDNDLTSGIPEPDFGEIISISSLDDTCFIRLDKVSEQEINDYIETLIADGYSNYARQELEQGQLIFSGSQQKYYVYLVYDSSQTVTISISYNEVAQDVADVLLPQTAEHAS